MIMPGIIFEELGFKYIGPIDGHNIEELENVFKKAKVLRDRFLYMFVLKKARDITMQGKIRIYSTGLHLLK